MAAVNDFKIYMTARLGEILRERILPAEVTVGTVTHLEDGTKAMVDLTYKGEVYSLTYPKFDVERLLDGYTIPTFRGELTTVHELAPLFLSKFSLPLTVDDFVDGPLGTLTDFVIVPDSPCWRGKFLIQQSLPTSIDRPLHKFTMDGTGANTGMASVPLSANHNYVDFLGKKWLSVTTPVLLGAGVDLEIRGDFTLDFEIVANSLGDVYGQLFTQDGSSAVVVGNMWTARSGLGAGMENRFSMVSVGYTANTEVTTPRLLNDTPMRITLTRQGDNWTWYANGVRVWEYTAKPVLSGPFKYFGSNPARSKQYLRELQYWQHCLTTAERLSLFDLPSELEQPLHEFLFDGDTSNTGKDGRAMTVPMTYGQLGGRNVAYLPPSGVQLFGNGIEMLICGDYTYDFVVLFTATPPSYICFMSVDTTTVTAVGAFYFYQGRQYEYLVHPSGSAILADPAPVLNKPYRITIRSLNGVTTKYVNGEKRIEYASPPRSLNRTLKTFRDPSYGFTNAGIDYIKMWDRGLSDAELAILFTM